ncbi:putative MATH and UCH domain protein [Talaromyces proteolyticus]|uniref:MATH and UCH domain protein n=1 Tax=Talaromyces proteolyticus TaxID=1131652 RepID=A0AAD4Q102_9EURO|nr:putative MATH and UCH domain protein [Talaromyces proteolyticus]KAH8697816.1 putative MATH and UCH domain protein [Talaromyces proteolyticus]
MDSVVALPAPDTPAVAQELTETNGPDGPSSSENALAADMDTTDDTAQSTDPSQPETPAPTTLEPETSLQNNGEEAVAATDAPTDAPTAAEEAEESTSAQNQDAPSDPAPEATEQPPPPPPEEDPATWADIEEDTSAPDEEELKEIEAGRGDYSALEYDYWEKSFYSDVDDPEYHAAEKARLAWKIKGVRGTKENPNRAKVICSPPAFVGGYWWTIKFFPRGNGVNHLSIYIECSKEIPKPDNKMPETEFTVRTGAADEYIHNNQPQMDIQIPALANTNEWFENYKKCYAYTGANCGASESSDENKEVWRVSAQIGVILYNPKEPRTGWMQSSCHQFNPHNVDWGWTSFHGPWDEIHIRQKGQRQALLRDDTLAFDAYIRVFDDPTKSLWWHVSDSEPVWDSLSLTGYRSMGDTVINHSAEVAGLAAWIHLAPFRKIIQSIDVHEHRRNSNVKPRPFCEALQEFLWRLGSRSDSVQCVDTDKVTSTLRNLQEFSSDVIEFWERVRRTLELELEGTSAAEELARIFDSPPVSASDPSGSNVTRTLTPSLISSIRIPVDKEKTVEGAITRYFEDQSGKWCRWSLPPVLHVDFNRQRFDHSSRQWKLLYNRVNLDETLDLSQYTATNQSGEYDLYGFIIHRGRRTSGKFFSILRPGGPSSKWLAFDDGSHNRVECLTRKAALEAHVGLEDSKLKDANDKTGHDFVVAALYVRHDVVDQYLPGPLEKWEVEQPLRTYFETGSYPTPDESPATEPKLEPTVQVEVYGLPSLNENLGSIFDTYDLMAEAKRANNAMYLTLPKSTSLVDLRKKIAFSKSNASEQINNDQVRLWKIGHTNRMAFATLLFDRQEDLTQPLSLQESGVIRFWTHILSEEEAKSFGIPDPTPVIKVVEDKPEGTVEVRDAPDSDEDRAVAEGSGTTGNNNTQSQPDVNTATPAPQVAEALPNAEENPIVDVAMTEDAANEAAIAAAVASDLDQMDVEATTSAGQASEEIENQQAQDTVMEDSPPPESQDSGSQSTTDTSGEASSETTTPAVVLPSPHLYYFIQIFDIEKQVLKPAGVYISPLGVNIKSEIRSHLGWEDSKDFLMWSRFDGTSITALSPGETFSHSLGDGHCFIVGERVSKDQRSKLGAAGLFTNPDRLIQYIWASSRSHPTRAFTGTKTIDATFNGDYYSGEFNKGYYHGKGTHIADNGTTYTGDFTFGQRNGQGKMEYPSGDTYDGDWLEDQRHGQGTFIERKTGNKYVGGYKDGKRHGKGISYWEVADEEMDLCQICYSEEQDALFYDCGHVCACVTCAREVEICPICRKSVIRVVKIYKM